MRILHYQLSKDKLAISGLSNTSLHYESSMTDEHLKEYDVAKAKVLQFEADNSYATLGEWPNRMDRVFINEEVEFFAEFLNGESIMKAKYKAYLYE